MPFIYSHPYTSPPQMWSQCCSYRPKKVAREDASPTSRSAAADPAEPIPRPPDTDELYKYPSLSEDNEEIRILWLYPAALGDDLMCAFGVVSSNPSALNSTPPFEALSYTWGPPEPSEQIKCTDAICSPHYVDSSDEDDSSDDDDGAVDYIFPLTTSRWLTITPNLASALRALRHEDEMRSLWVDALCINQTDLDEKTSQVRNMHTMYQFAKRTIIYLGNSGHRTEQGLRTCIALASMEPGNTQRIPSSGIDNLVIAEKRPDDWPPLDSGHGSDSSSANWAAFCDIVECEWFGRTWIVQELALARDPIIYLGEYSLPWDTLQAAMEFVLYTGIKKSHWRHASVYTAYQLSEIRIRRTQLEQAILRYGDDWQQHALEDAGQLSLWPLLLRTRSLQVTDPRDKVFALLNIGITESSDMIDYRKSTREVYISILAKLISSHPIITFLSWVDGAGNLQHDIPTWVPDWYPPHSSVSVLVELEHTIARAGTASPPQIIFPDASTFKAGPCPLTVRGILAQKITCVVGLAQNDEKDRAQKRVAMLNSVADPYPTTSMSYLDCYARVVDPNPSTDYLLQDDRPERFWDVIAKPPCVVSSSLAQLPRRNPPLTQNDLFKRLPAPIAVPLDLERFAAVLRCSSRRLALTEDGFLGLVPECTLEGDEVAVLFGHSMPVVVRPLADGSYNFIGDAFVLGIMDGEVLDQPLQERVVDFRFL